MSTQRCLMAIGLFEFTGEQIGQLKQPGYYGMPQYTLNAETGAIVESEYYLQFVGDGDEKYFMFDVAFLSGNLGEEVSNVGYDELFQKFDFRGLFGVLPKMEYSDYRKMIPREALIVVDMEYWNAGDGDYDLDVAVIGYLDKDMKLIEI